jgi:uncharacterized protein with GYD domain
MKISEIETIKPLKPKTPEQQRIATLKDKKDAAAKTLKDERERQKNIKARERISSAQATLTSIAR